MLESPHYFFPDIALLAGMELYYQGYVYEPIGGVVDQEVNKTSIVPVLVLSNHANQNILYVANTFGTELQVFKRRNPLWPDEQRKAYFEKMQHLKTELKRLRSVRHNHDCKGDVV